MADNLNLPKIEEKILKFWKDRKIFEKTLELRNPPTGGVKRFVFFEGPPTANNHPGIHHLIGRAFKDLFVRYKTMRGYYVPRKAGWDTHGLPVELEIEKELGLKSKKDIEAYGIAKFNAKAKENVWKYKQEWEDFTNRSGMWLDMEHPYITYETEYIETLWWIIKEIYNKDLFYEGHKVLPWCTRCGTALSSHEVAQEYRDVTDVSVYVKFKLKPGQKIAKKVLPENTSILAWTTTPWTLPGNVALAVAKNITYVIVKEGGQNFIVAKELVEKIVEGGEIVQEITGKDLVGLEYEALFDIEKLKSGKSYKVYPADFVTTTDGTGIVHTAVMYGEDDYRLGMKLSLPAFHTVDEQGKFTQDVVGFAGQYVKAHDTEKAILEYLKSKNFLFKEETYTHSYPHCWRCRSPLLYYAHDGWFIAISKLQKQLIKNNRKVNWIPEHLKEGRFGEWLRGEKDWNFSRERYWGTPLPIWRCDNCDNKKVTGSLIELEENRFYLPNTYYILRHGDSTKNSPNSGEPLISSKLDHDKYDLTEEGKKQIEQVAKLIQEAGGLEAIYSSPFRRTKQTAEIIARKLGLEVHIDERLKELDHGSDCEGQPVGVCTMESNGRRLDNKKHDDGETWNDVRSRMYSFIKEIDAEHTSSVKSPNDDHGVNKKILIVSHGDPLWLLESTLLGLSVTDNNAYDLRTKNYMAEGELRNRNLKNYPHNDRGEVDLHRPYIDDVALKCDKCQSKMLRIKEVADVWFDSGAMPFAQWHYPFENKKEFEDNFPADFISEGIDQTRGWFYTLLAISTLLGKGPAYRNVVSYSHILDDRGRKMSKSLGNTISPWEVMDNFGADAARWYFYTVNSPGESKLFSLQNSMQQPKSFFNNLLNSLHFFELYDKPTGDHPRIKPRSQNMLDEWILSRLHNVISQTTKFMDNYDPTSAGREIEVFLLNDLSNWWLRRSRELFQRPKNKKVFNHAFELLRYVLFESSKIIAPMAPFTAEHIYKRVANQKESVHLEDWPKAKKKFIKPELEKVMVEVRDVVTAGLATRKSKNLKVRQPLASITIKRSYKFDPGLEELIKAELNIKEVFYRLSMEESVMLDEHITRELMLEGYARELMRQIQDMRKEAGYKLDDNIFAAWESESTDIIASFEKFSDEIKHTTLLKDLSARLPAGRHGHQENLAYDIEKEFDLVPGVKVWLGIRR